MTVKISLRTLLLALAIVLLPGAALAVQPPTDAKDQYVPVDQLQPVEELPAAPLVAAAYGVAWLAVLIYVWSLWRRLGAVDRELTEVARRLQPGVKR